jgi:altronate dehydratase large subunit
VDGRSKEVITEVPDNAFFLAYPRIDGAYGIRNHLAIISTVACANVVAERIAQKVEGVACTHPYGCDQLGEDAVLTLRVLMATGLHPNVGAVLVVGLGCEEISAQELAHSLSIKDKPALYLLIQDEGGTSKAVESGVRLALELKAHMPTENNRKLVPLENLIIGLECGGSDYTSGLAANPAVGIAADLLVDHGATVIFGESTEILGAEHILAARSSSHKVSEFIFNKVTAIEDAARLMKVDIRGAQPSPGNIEGGLSSIEEKSLGGICKSGSRQISGVLEFAETPRLRGLHFMDTPGNDLACTCGLVSGGAHLVLFTTGRGTPMGFATAPVLKITANKKIALRMGENIDLDLSEVLEGTIDLYQAGKMILKKILETANGGLVAAEKVGHFEYGFHRIGPTL